MNMAYYTSVMILSWLSLGVLCVLAYENDRMTPKEKRSLFLTYAIIALSALFEWLGLKLSGNESVPLAVLKAVKCGDYIFTPAAGGAFVMQVKGKSVWKSAIYFIVAFNALFQVAAAFGGWMLVFDGQKRYHDGPLYVVYVALYFVVIACIFAQFISYGRKFRRQNKVSVYATLAVIVAGILLQMRAEDFVRVSYAGLTLGAALFFIHNAEFSQIAADDKIREQKQKIMLSQIQPHFFSNCLAVIQETYRVDAEKGDKALTQFSRFLRNSVDSLNGRQFLPFAEELERVRQYLDLQRLRFGDELFVKYELEARDFLIPTLTLQPLVENAVTYGARKRSDHLGLVTIRTRECLGHYEVSVIDNGPGFVPQNDFGKDDRSHIGIENVRGRLELICGGSLEIRSVLGEGTEAAMILPKQWVGGGKPL